MQHDQAAGLFCWCDIGYERRALRGIPRNGEASDEDHSEFKPSWPPESQGSQNCGCPADHHGDNRYSRLTPAICEEAGRDTRDCADPGRCERRQLA